MEEEINFKRVPTLTLVDSAGPSEPEGLGGQMIVPPFLKDTLTLTLPVQILDSKKTSRF